MTRITAPIRARCKHWLPVTLVLLLASAAPARAQYRTEPGVRTLASTPPTTSFTYRATAGARVPTLDCDLDRTRGRQAANTLHSGSGWMIGGVASGVLLGLIGTGVITAVAASSSASVNHVPEGAEPACYRDGYAGRARSMNTTSALTGGLIGTLALVIIVVSASGS